MAARYCRAHFSGLHPIWRRSLLERFAEPGRLCLGILMPSRFGKIPLREKGWIFFYLVWVGKIFALINYLWVKVEFLKYWP